MLKTANNPLVSIVIPCYNHRQFLERCLNSVAEQIYENIEVVIVDDCSPDASCDEIERLIRVSNWQNRFPNLTQFHPLTKNQGAHNAINYGIDKANGSIIAILNSDDMYHPQRIARIVPEIQISGHEFVFSGVEFVGDDDRIVTDSHPVAQRYCSTQQLARQYPTVGFASLISNVAMSTGNFVFTKDLYRRVGKFRDFLYCHDWDFLLRCILHTEPVFLNQELYYYRFHGKNSFESLHSIGEKETTQILANILFKMKNHWLPNPIAPSPLNWPTFFELFLHWFNLERYLKMV
jgi:glycosyltransferase involved in cell wall biosynthesis